jgi:hypothetical protein
LRERLAAGPLAIDRATRRVTVHGLPVALAAKEYELLVKLATQPTRVFTKDELLRDVWGFRSFGSKRRMCRRGVAPGALTSTTRTQPRVGTAAGRGSSDWSRPPARASRGRSEGLRGQGLHRPAQDLSAGARTARSEGDGERRRGRAGERTLSVSSGFRAQGSKQGRACHALKGRGEARPARSRRVLVSHLGREYVSRGG